MSDLIPTSQLALGLFLLANLAVGLWAGRNVKTFKDYAVANRSLGSGVLIVTPIATSVDHENFSLRGSYYVEVSLACFMRSPFQ